MFVVLVEAVSTQIPARVDRIHERSSALKATSRRRRFENMVERHQGRLRRLAFGMVGDAGRVDDVLQEAFLRAYRSLPARFESENHEAAWLYRIVHRTCLNELRSSRRRKDVSGLAMDQMAVDGVSDDGMVVAAALSELPANARAVILLVDLIGFDYEGAAAVLRVPRGTIASRLNAARSLLRESLERHDA